MEEPFRSLGGIARVPSSTARACSRGSRAPRDSAAAAAPSGEGPRQRARGGILAKKGNPASTAAPSSLSAPKRKGEPERALPRHLRRQLANQRGRHPP